MLQAPRKLEDLPPRKRKPKAVQVRMLRFCRLLPGLCRVVVGFPLFFDRRFGTIYNKGEPCVRSPLFKGRETARRTHPESQIPLEHLCRTAAETSEWVWPLEPGEGNKGCSSKAA